MTVKVNTKLQRIYKTMKSLKEIFQMIKMIKIYTSQCKTIQDNLKLFRKLQVLQE